MTFSTRDFIILLVFILLEVLMMITAALYMMACMPILEVCTVLFMFVVMKFVAEQIKSAIRRAKK